MQRNIAWLPIVGYGLLTAATGAGSWYGWRELQSYQQRSEQELIERQQASEAAEAEAGARNRQLMAQLNPFMIAGTVAMTGLGMFIMLTGMRRQRRYRRELIESYYEEN